MRDQVSCQYKTKGKITVLYISVFKILERRWEAAAAAVALLKPVILSFHNPTTHQSNGSNNYLNWLFWCTRNKQSPF
jgi:hypothetical protein